jgi:transposase
MLDHKFDPNSSATRRVEVFVGTGRRRRWSADEKARIVEETLAAGAVASEVARRHGISAQQLFGWRRAARLRGSAAGVPDFAPVVLEAPAQEPRPSDGGVLEIVVGAMVARIPLTADGATLARIVRALRGAS